MAVASAADYWGYWCNSSSRLNSRASVIPFPSSPNKQHPHLLVTNRAGFVLPTELNQMPNLTSQLLNSKDEPVLQQLEIYLQHLSQDKKASLAITVLYEATEPAAIDFDYVYPSFVTFGR